MSYRGVPGYGGGRMVWPNTFRRTFAGALFPFLALFLALGLSRSAAAQVPPPGFAGFKHVQWDPDVGAPDGINQIVQTSDGYLWLAGDALYRFDGVTFERIDWPAGSHRSRLSPFGLMVGRNGELWIGLRGGGGVAVYRNGAVHDTAMPNPPPTIGKMVQAPDGSVWAASAMFDGELRRLRAGRWESVARTLQLPPGVVMDMLVSRDGWLWAVLTHSDGDTGALVYLGPHASRFQIMPDRIAGRPHMTLDPNGGLWISDTSGIRKIFDGQGRRPASPIRYAVPANARTATIAFDRPGGIWGTTASGGIFHIPNAAQSRIGSNAAPDVFRAVNGLTSDFSYAVLRDREGSIWFGGDGGIDQFRTASAVQELAIPPEPARGLAIADADDGSVYVASGRRLFWILPHASPRQISMLGPGEISLCRALAGGIWVVSSSSTTRVRADRTEASPGYRGEQGPTSCAEDRLGRLWVALFDRTLIWRDAQGWHRPSGRLASEKVWDMIAAPGGYLAFTAPPDLVMVSGSRIAVQSGPGAASMIAAGARDIFLSSSGGLVRVRNGVIARLDQSRFPWLPSLRDLVQTPQGETWMIGRTGIVRVSTAELDRAFTNPRAELDHRIYNAQDGLLSQTQHGGFAGPQSAVGGDGRVWFLNRQGAAYFDPATLQPNRLPPPVAIRALASGGHVWFDPADIVLPPGTRSLEITYAGLSLAQPQRMRFRYRLEGVDDGWVDAAAQRTASYSNLKPGRYRFQVLAANNDGVWNESGASVAFRIRPTFVQDWPFKLLCGVAALGLLWLMHALRLRFVAERIRLRMAERIGERERIARELHDTLLQAVQSLTLRFQIAVDDLPRQEAARPALEDALDRADQVIAEGRDRVRDLRAFQDSDIEQITRDTVARQAFEPGVDIAISSVGTPRALEPLVLDEVARIVGEAVFNIRRHANASRIEIEIIQRANFHMRFVDNGVGIDPEVARQCGRPGHFGLPGMRERARKLRGELVVMSREQGGTELLLTVPGSVAYKNGKPSFLARLRSPD